MLMVTPVGNGSWDAVPSIGETQVSATDVRATIKFTDVTRITSDTFNNTISRRRSKFYFVLYRIN